MKLLCYLKEDEFNTTNYVYPTFSIDNEGVLVKLSKEDVVDIFPHKGTFYMPAAAHKIKHFVDKLFFVEFDEMNPHILSDNFDPEVEDMRAKYKLAYSDLIYPKVDELIEVIDFDYTKNDGISDFMDILDYDSRREIILNEIPLNKYILLHMEDKLYGPFSYEDISDEDDSKVRLKARESENYRVSAYSYDELNEIIHTSRNSYRSLQLKNFIYNINELADFDVLEKIDFIEDRVLVNEFAKVLNSNSEEVVITKKQQKEMKGLLEFGNVLPFTQERKDRILRVNEIVALFNEKKNEITNEYINTDAGKEFLKRNIIEDLSVLDNIPKYSYILEKWNKRIEDLEENFNSKKNEYDDLVSKTQDTKEKEKKDFSNSILDKRKEYDEVLELIKKEKETLGNIDKLKNYKSEAFFYERTIEQSKDKLKKIEKKIEEKLNTGIEELLVEDVLNDTIIDKFRKKRMLKEMELDYPMFEVEKNIEIEELINHVHDCFKNSGRKIDKIEIINYLITINQSFMTVFAGPPGTGKTSFCRIVAKSLGLYDKRFLKVPVKRGWTSSNDLIGYYNPLSQTIEKSNTGLLDTLRVIDYESKNQIELPYMVLLDEANLSPLEHYWSDFISISDSSSNKKIYLTDQVTFEVSSGLKFLSTINYDHTTEVLSPRFLDRVAVIRMDSNEEYDFNNIDCEDDLICDTKIISQEKLNEFFVPTKKELENVLDNDMEYKLNEILKTCRNDMITYIPVSPRTRKSIFLYCAVGKKYFVENKNLSLDFALSQFLLPQINGDGELYKSLLIDLEKVLESTNMVKSKDVVSHIINKGRKDYDNYKFF